MVFQKKQRKICLPEFVVSRKLSISSIRKKVRIESSLRKEHTNIADIIARNLRLDIASVVANKLIGKFAKFMVLL